jgi:hypothetical protein
MACLRVLSFLNVVLLFYLHNEISLLMPIVVESVLLSVLFDLSLFGVVITFFLLHIVELRLLHVIAVVVDFSLLHVIFDGFPTQSVFDFSQLRIVSEFFRLRIIIEFSPFRIKFDWSLLRLVVMSELALVKRTGISPRAGEAIGVDFVLILSFPSFAVVVFDPRFPRRRKRNFHVVSREAFVPGAVRVEMPGVVGVIEVDPVLILLFTSFVVIKIDRRVSPWSKSSFYVVRRTVLDKVELILFHAPQRAIDRSAQDATKHAAQCN